MRRALCSKGFEEDRQRDHCYFFLHYNGKKSSINTKISHSLKDIDERLCGRMAKQLRLTGQQFRSLIDCELSRDGYCAILIEGEHLRPGDA